jgi:hypothetical protein
MGLADVLKKGESANQDSIYIPNHIIRHYSVMGGSQKI